MLHWLWSFAKRHQTRALMYGGLGLMSGAAAHMLLMHRFLDPHALSPRTIWLVISFHFADLLCVVCGVAMTWIAMWRVRRGKS